MIQKIRVLCARRMRAVSMPRIGELIQKMLPPSSSREFNNSDILFRKGILSPILFQIKINKISDRQVNALTSEFTDFFTALIHSEPRTLYTVKK